MSRTLSPRGVLFIASFEGFVATCYNDAGRNATIGYGHLLHMGPVTAADKKKWGTITRAQGIQLLKADAGVAVNGVHRDIKVALTQGQFDALVSFAYNCGTGALGGSVGRAVNSKPRVWNLLRMRAWHNEVKAALLQWDHVNGVVLPGLYRRRLDEANLFSTGKYVI